MQCIKASFAVQRFRIHAFVLLASAMWQYNAVAQETDSLSLRIGTGVVMSTQEDFLPHYLVNNQWGVVQEDQALFVEGLLNYRAPVGKHLKLSTGFSFRNDLLSSYYVQLQHDLISLNIGGLQKVVGGLGNSLSSGSMALGNNARPLPMIELEVPDYINVPWTKGFFKTKGHLAHGWFEDNRHVSNALLHSKSFYLMLDLNKEIGFTAASGIVHFAQFGGTSPNGDEQPSSFSDYLKVFLGAGIPNPDGTTAGESNGLGNHLGIIETTVTKQLGQHKLSVNYQKPFEDEGGIQYVSLTDYLFGLEWELPKEGNFIRKVYLEYIQTKWQGGPGLPDPNPVDGVLSEEDNFGYSFGGRDDLYNNWLYRDGWTYNSMILSNPLFLTYQRTLNFFATYPDYAVSVANNRLRAVHLGIEAISRSGIEIKGLFTYSSNFGIYSGLYQGRFGWDGAATDPNFEYVFRPAQHQFYSLIELSKDQFWNDKPWGARIRLAVDHGDLYNAFGFELLVHYQIMSN